MWSALKKRLRPLDFVDPQRRGAVAAERAAVLAGRHAERCERRVHAIPHAIAGMLEPALHRRHPREILVVDGEAEPALGLRHGDRAERRVEPVEPFHRGAVEIVVALRPGGTVPLKPPAAIGSHSTSASR
jgi:hypothetical protein